MVLLRFAHSMWYLMRLDLNNVLTALPSSAGITEIFWDSLTTLPKSKEGYGNTQHHSHTELAPGAQIIRQKQ